MGSFLSSVLSFTVIILKFIRHFFHYAAHGCIPLLGDWLGYSDMSAWMLTMILWTSLESSLLTKARPSDVDY